RTFLKEQVWQSSKRSRCRASSPRSCPTRTSAFSSTTATPSWRTRPDGCPSSRSGSSWATACRSSSRPTTSRAHGSPTATRASPAGLQPGPADPGLRRYQLGRAVTAARRVDRDGKLAVGAGLLRRLGRRLRRRLAQDLVVLLDQQEHGERDDQERDDAVDEQPVIDRGGARLLCGGQRRVLLARQVQEQTGEVQATGDQA